MKTFKIEPRDYASEINEAIANNELKTLETDFYENSLNFIGDVKIVFESIHNK